ncbi:hypothetical protein ARMSODRAFT_302097 [Armillaria solidipes]|uniref:Uncharacterized protein n=1 Tax=Armillaria solidipes TaxID=1076256 RepID=A0A2H3BXP4_9AGAR|nr:hypothetical protein ARMSODRAFT_302097 [Armillaria solidipes]
MDVVLPKIRIFYQPPYDMYDVEGSLDNWKRLRSSARRWKKKEGPESLTQLRIDALAQEEEDGQRYVSEASDEDTRPVRGDDQDIIYVSDNSEPEPQARRPVRGHRGCLKESRNKQKVVREEELEPRKKPTGNRKGRRVKIQTEKRRGPKQERHVMEPPCYNCAQRERQCIVEADRITSNGRLKIKCVHCIFSRRLCGKELEEQGARILAGMRK